MPRTWDVDWKGKEIRQRVIQATREAINETMGDCVVEAQPNTPVVTGNLRRSIKIQELAEERNGVVSGLWGSSDTAVGYALAIEAGSHTRSGNFVQGRFMLRNAADSQYPTLQGRIKRKLG